MPGQPSEPCAAQAGEPFMNGIFIVFIILFICVGTYCKRKIFPFR